MMKSHEYHFGVVQMASATGLMILPVVVFAGIMHLGALLKILPTPWPALDVDHTILTHQANASVTSSGAEVLFIGDSSCLMDVSAKALEENFQGQAHFLNLGSFMYVGWNGYATMLTRYAEANPGRLRTIVLLVHPEMLRGVGPVSHYLVFLSDFYAGADQTDAASFRGQLRGTCGLSIFEDRFWSRLPLPLPREYGRFYGFNLDLNHFMEKHHGSAVDPHQYVPAPGEGNAEYRLAPAIQPACMALKAAVPPGAQLVLGLAPVPESFASKDHAFRYHRLLQEWGQQIQAEVLLTNLPSTMPDACFASTAHLNEKGASRYTEMLAECLKNRLHAR
jgi:hypothetical protein